MVCVALLVAMLVALHCVSARLMFMELDAVNSSILSHQLDNQHIVMVGDSLTRYQYLSLVYLAHNEQFYSPAPGTRNILVETTFKSWDNFYSSTNEMFAPNEYCDCYRNSSINLVYENRYYYNKNRNLSISYIQYFGDERALHGHWQPSDNETNHHLHKPDHAFVPFHWNYTQVDDAIANIAGKLQPRPSVLLLNAGHWLNHWDDQAHRQRVLNRTLPLFDRVVWKTTNYRRDHSLPGFDEHCFGDERLECLSLAWTKFLSKEDFWDTKHFRAPIYNDINIQFIHQLVTKKPLHLSPLAEEYRQKVVVVKNKEFVVDGNGILRFIDKNVSAACTHNLTMRAHVLLHTHFLINNLLGSTVSFNCTL